MSEKEKMEFTDEMREKAKFLFPMNNEETFSFVPKMYKALPEEFHPRIELRPMNSREKELYRSAYNKSVYGSMSPEFMDETGKVNEERDTELEKAKTEIEKDLIAKKYSKKIEAISKKYISQTMTQGSEHRVQLESVSLNCVTGWENFLSCDLETLIEYKGSKKDGLHKDLRPLLHVDLVTEIVNRVSDISGLAKVEITGLEY
jgi:hypothetical protein